MACWLAPELALWLLLSLLLLLCLVPSSSPPSSPSSSVSESWWCGHSRYRINGCAFGGDASASTLNRSLHSSPTKQANPGGRPVPIQPGKKGGRENREGEQRERRDRTHRQNTDRTQRERQNTHTEREREMKRAMKMGCFPFCTNTFVFFAPKKKKKKKNTPLSQKRKYTVFFFLLLLLLLTRHLLTSLLCVLCFLSPSFVTVHAYTQTACRDGPLHQDENEPRRHNARQSLHYRELPTKQHHDPRRRFLHHQ